MLVIPLGMMLTLISAGLGLTDTFELSSAKAKAGRAQPEPGKEDPRRYRGRRPLSSNTSFSTETLFILNQG